MERCFDEEMCVDNKYKCKEMPMHKKQIMDDCIANRLLAHAYVPWQRYEEAFSPKEALMKGTLFPELYGVYPIPK